MVRIERVLLDGTQQSVRSELEVPPGRHRIEIAYSAVDLSAPERVRFRHRLVGYDSEWIEVGTERSATFTRLPPGRYQFEVLASDASGVWAETPSTLEIAVPQPFWQRWWFGTGVVILAMLAVTGWIILLARRRVRRATERARLASELATGLLHEARQPLQVVVSSIELAARAGERHPEAAQRALARAETGSRRLATLLQAVEELEQKDNLSTVTYAGNHRMIDLGGERDGTEDPDRR
jgi:signal transduction histidine kinase